MKHLLIILLLGISTVATAQPSSSRLKTRIVDDSQTLSIQIDGNKNGQSIHYNRTFDVASMNGFQKDVLKYRAFISQGLVPPLHDMVSSIATILGIVSLAITLLIVGFKARSKALRVGF